MMWSFASIINLFFFYFFFPSLYHILHAENFCGGDYSDFTSTSDFVLKDAMLNKVVSDLPKRRIPLSVKKACHNYENSHHSEADDWHIEISVPKAHNISLADVHNEESEGCGSVTKTFERMSADIASAPDIRCEYVSMDDKQESSSVSNLFVDNFETKSVTVSHDSVELGGLLRPIGQNQKIAVEAINSDEQIYPAKMRDRRSLDSTVTENSFQTLHGCSQVASEMAYIRKQLLEIENRQSNFMELLQVYF